MINKGLLNRLRLPEFTGIADLDDPNNIHLIRNIIHRKPFLKRIYQSFYQDMLGRCINTPPLGDFIEMGSGAGFIKKLAPHVITSDVLPYDGVDLVFSALDIPLQKSSVSAFLMIDVLHHVKDSVRFFEEMQRCLKTGGKIIMVEPANTPWSTFIYTRFHHEPFEPSGEWGFEEGGPLTGANMAIPWIIFFRDMNLFTRRFPQLKVCSIQIHTPFRYLLSGGLSLKQLLPSFFYPVTCLIEWLLSPFNRHIGMFMTIELEKIS